MEKVIETMTSWERTDALYELLDAMYSITEAEDPKDMFDIAEKMLAKYSRKRAPQPYESWRETGKVIDR